MVEPGEHRRALYVGDKILLHCEYKSGLLCSNGHVDRRCFLTPLDDDAPCGSIRGCIFRVASASEHLSQSFLENANNPAELRRIYEVGRMVLYKNYIQLQHRATKKYLCVKVRADANIHDYSLELYLRDNPNTLDSWFCIMNRRSGNDEQRVLQGDEVILQAGRWQQQIMVGARNIKGLPEVFTDLEPENEAAMVWRLRPWALDIDTPKKQVRGGDVVMLRHKETGGSLVYDCMEGCTFLSCSRIQASDSSEEREDCVKKVFLRMANPEWEKEDVISLHSLWEVVPYRIENGGAPMTTEKPYSLRHLATGKFLVGGPPVRKRRSDNLSRVLEDDEDDSGTDVVGQSISRRSVEIRAIPSLQVGMSDKPYGKCKVYFNKSEDEKQDVNMFGSLRRGEIDIENESAVSLQLMDHGVMNYRRASHSKSDDRVYALQVEAENIEYVSKLTPSSRDMWKVAPKSNLGAGVQRRVSLTGEYTHPDMFEIRKVRADVVMDVERLAESYAVLKRFLREYGEIDQQECVYDMNVSRGLVNLELLHKFMTDRYHAGTDVILWSSMLSQRKQFMRELRMLVVLVDLATVSDENFYPSLGDRNDPETFRAIQDISSLSCRILTMTLRDDVKNCFYMINLLPIILSQISKHIGGAEVIIEMFRDKRGLLELKNFRQEAMILDAVDEFMRLILENDGFVTAYLDFLTATCTCNHSGITVNQNHVLRGVLDPERPFLRMEVSSNQDSFRSEDDWEGKYSSVFNEKFEGDAYTHLQTARIDTSISVDGAEKRVLPTPTILEGSEEGGGGGMIEVNIDMLEDDEEDSTRPTTTSGAGWKPSDDVCTSNAQEKDEEENSSGQDDGSHVSADGEQNGDIHPTIGSNDVESKPSNELEGFGIGIDDNSEFVPQGFGIADKIIRPPITDIDEKIDTNIFRKPTKNYSVTSPSMGISSPNKSRPKSIEVDSAKYSLTDKNSESFVGELPTFSSKKKRRNRASTSSSQSPRLSLRALRLKTLQVNVWTTSCSSSMMTPIETFARHMSHPELAKMLRLMWNLCTGQNVAAIHELRQSKLVNFSFGHILHCMMNTELPNPIRAEYCRLMLHMYVDVPPKRPIATVNIIRRWPPETHNNATYRRRRSAIDKVVLRQQKLVEEMDARNDKAVLNSIGGKLLNGIKHRQLQKQASHITLNKKVSESLNEDRFIYVDNPNVRHSMAIRIQSAWRGYRVRKKVGMVDVVGQASEAQSELEKENFRELKGFCLDYLVEVAKMEKPQNRMENALKMGKMERKKNQASLSTPPSLHGRVPSVYAGLTPPARGPKSRSFLVDEQQKSFEEEKMREWAVTRIQNIWRGYMSRRLAEKGRHQPRLADLVVDIYGLDNNSDVLRAVLDLCKHMVSYGIFNTRLGIRQMVRHLVHINEGNWEPGIKMAAMETFNLIYNMYTNRRITDLLDEYYTHSAGKGKAVLTHNDILRIEGILFHVEELDMEAGEMSTHNDYGRLTGRFVDSLLHKTIAATVEPSLERAAFSMLFRHFTQHAELIRHAKKVVLLVEETSKKTYPNANGMLQQIALVTGKIMSFEEMRRILGIIRKLTKYCVVEESPSPSNERHRQSVSSPSRRRDTFFRANTVSKEAQKPNTKNQNLLRALKAHTVMLNFLSQFLGEDASNLELDSSLQDIFCRAYNFLEKFCRGNAENQKVLYTHIDMYIIHLRFLVKGEEKLCRPNADGMSPEPEDTIISNRYGDMTREITEMICEMIKGNPTVLARLSERFLRDILNLIGDTLETAFILEKNQGNKEMLIGTSINYGSHYLSIYDTMVSSTGDDIDMQKQLILRLLMERPGTVLMLYDDIDLCQVCKASDRRPSGRLEYHLTLLDLLGKCSKDCPEVFTVTSRFYNVGHLVNVIVSERTPLFVKSAYLSFVKSSNPFFRDSKDELETLVDMIMEGLEVVVEEMATRGNLLEGQIWDDLMRFLLNECVNFLSDIYLADSKAIAVHSLRHLIDMVWRLIICNNESVRMESALNDFCELIFNNWAGGAQHVVASIFDELHMMFGDARLIPSKVGSLLPQTVDIWQSVVPANKSTRVLPLDGGGGSANSTVGVAKRVLASTGAKLKRRPIVDMSLQHQQNSMTEYNVEVGTDGMLHVKRRREGPVTKRKYWDSYTRGAGKGHLSRPPSPKPLIHQNVQRPEVRTTHQVFRLEERDGDVDKDGVQLTQIVASYSDTTAVPLKSSLFMGNLSSIDPDRTRRVSLKRMSIAVLAESPEGQAIGLKLIIAFYKAYNHNDFSLGEGLRKQGTILANDIYHRATTPPMNMLHSEGKRVGYALGAILTSIDSSIFFRDYLPEFTKRLKKLHTNLTKTTAAVAFDVIMPCVHVFFSMKSRESLGLNNSEYMGKEAQSSLDLVDTVLRALYLIVVKGLPMSAKHQETAWECLNTLVVNVAVYGVFVEETSRVIAPINDSKKRLTAIREKLEYENVGKQALKAKDIHEVSNKVNTYFHIRLAITSSTDAHLDLDLQNDFTQFVETLESHFGTQDLATSKEFNQLVHELSKQKNNGIVSRLIELLATSLLSSNTVKLEADDEMTLYVMSLRLLRAMVESHRDVDGELTQTGIKVQDQLNALGASVMVVKLISRSNGVILLESLLLGIALLSGGNRKVQESIHTFLAESKESTFFSTLARLIRTANISLRALGEQIDDENVWVFDDSSVIDEVLLYLQMCCEGHYAPLQNYFRHQSMDFRSVNVVLEIVSLLTRLLGKLDDLTSQLNSYAEMTPAVEDAIRLTNQATRTITELVQGPCFENQVCAIEAKVCEISVGILSIIEYYEDHSYAKSTKKTYIPHPVIVELQDNITAMIMGCMEGVRDMSLLKQMAEQVGGPRLDFETIRALMNNEGTVNMYQRFNATLQGASTDSQSKNELSFLNDIRVGSQRSKEALARKQDEIVKAAEQGVVKVGFTYIIMIRSLVEHISMQRLKWVVERPNEGISVINAHFFDYVGRIEIVRNGYLEPLYFVLPDICVTQWRNPLIQESKNELLYHVNRNNPLDKIEDFSNRSKDLAAMMKHHHKISREGPFPYYSIRKNVWYVMILLTVVFYGFVNVVLESWTSKFFVWGYFLFVYAIISVIAYLIIFISHEVKLLLPRRLYCICCFGWLGTCGCWGICAKYITVANNHLLKFIAKHDRYWHNVAFVLAVVNNLMILFTFENIEPYTTPNQFNEARFTQPLWSEIVLAILGNIQLILAQIKLVSFYIATAPLYARKGFVQLNASKNNWKKKGKKSKFWGTKLWGRIKRACSSPENTKKNKKRNPCSRCWSNIRVYLFNVILSRLFLFYHTYYIFSLLGAYFHPFFYVFHLTDFVERIRMVKNVLAAIFSNSGQLLLTGLFTVIIVYIYGIIGFYFLREAFVDSSGSKYCDTVLTCFLFLMNDGLRNGGGVGDILRDVQYFDNFFTETNVGQILYELSFFIIVLVILIAMVQGIIIDSFYAMRQAQAIVDEDKAKRCFVCSISASNFDRHTALGFRHHYKYEHNLWNFLFYQFYLEEKDRTEYNGQESYVANLMAKGDTSYYPIEKALALPTAYWGTNARDYDD